MFNEHIIEYLIFHDDSAECINDTSIVYKVVSQAITMKWLTAIGKAEKFIEYAKYERIKVKAVK